jgi:N-formylglutamate deformylase
LYPGQNVTGLCPTIAFSGRPIYRDGKAPDSEVIIQRRALYWQPYHAALQTELHRLKLAHGRALLWEGHSIRPELPYLFEGRLPDFNLGTAEGRSFPDARLRAVEAVLATQSDYNWISNGRFKGGYITRHYADPQAGIHAFQLELAQSTYLDESMTVFDAVKAAPVQALIARMMDVALHVPD